MQVDESESVESKGDEKNIALTLSLYLFYGSITHRTPPMHVDEGESGGKQRRRKNILLSLFLTLFLFYGRITDLTPPMQVDEGESVESKDDRRTYCTLSHSIYSMAGSRT
jgi:hypothetical protein